ncbi:MAG: VWA domain-containing protein [Candidatus Hodarchaeota archaeon]
MLNGNSRTNIYFYETKKIRKRELSPAIKLLNKSTYKRSESISLIEKIYEYKLQSKLTTQSAMELTQQAIQTKNLHAIEVLAELYPRIVTEVLQSNSTYFDLILKSNSLIFQIKEFFAPEERTLLFRKVIPKLLGQAERIYKTIDRTKYPETILYLPGRPWHLEKTISNFLLSGDSTLTYKHVICIERKKRRKCIVLLIDRSHSVLNYLRLIILTSVLFTLSLDIKDIALIGFDNQPDVLKGFNDFHTSRYDLVNQLVNIRSGGKTDIYSALESAERELNLQICPRKIVIIISDLLATSGKDFLPFFTRLEDVRIILTPRRQTIQLVKPIVGHLRRLSNVRLYYMSPDERSIPEILERVLYD